MMSPKDSFGEISLRYKTARSESIVCVESGRLAKVSRTIYQQVVMEDQRKVKVHGFLRKVDILSGVTDTQLSTIGNCLKRVKFKRVTGSSNRGKRATRSTLSRAARSSACSARQRAQQRLKTK